MEKCFLLFFLIFICKTSSQTLFEGDIVLTDDILREVAGSGVSYDAHTEKKWPNGIIPYAFDRGFDSNRRLLVKQAIREFEKKTCIRFIKRTDEVNYLNFIYGKGCYSYIGKHGNTSQDISIGHFCDSKGNVMHEMMHAIGFYHEQSRRDRDQYVEIIWENIQKGQDYNFLKYHEGKGDTLDEPYDYDSIMHYSNSAFGGGKTTIKSKKDPYRRMGQRVKLSDIDIRQMNKMYNCPSIGGPIPTQKPGATDPKTTMKVPNYTKPSGTKPIIPGKCADNRANCKQLSMNNGCTAFWKRSIMIKDCRKTCSLC